MADEDEALENKTVLVRSGSHMYDELRSFRTWFKWMCVDQSSPSSACLSWFVFSLLTVVVPWLSHYLLACSECDADHSRTYGCVTQLSMSSVAALSFICLSRFNKKYGLRRFLFLDKLCDESETVRNCYTQQLNVCIFFFPLPLSHLSRARFHILFLKMFCSLDSVSFLSFSIPFGKFCV